MQMYDLNRMNDVNLELKKIENVDSTRKKTKT